MFNDSKNTIKIYYSKVLGKFVVVAPQSELQDDTTQWCDTTEQANDAATALGRQLASELHRCVMINRSVHKV